MDWNMFARTVACLPWAMLDPGGSKSCTDQSLKLKGERGRLGMQTVQQQSKE